MSKLKKQIEETGGFSHWFINVFWYHYKWLTLVLVAILALVIYITVDAVRRVNYDAKIVIACDTYFDNSNLSQLDELKQVFANALGDVNGDGKVNIDLHTIYTGTGAMNTNSEEQMYVCLTDSDYVIYLMDADTAERYGSQTLGYFVDDLSNYGIASDSDNPCLLSLADNPVLQRAGLDDMYLAIMDYSNQTNDEDDADRTARAVDMVNALLESK